MHCKVKQILRSKPKIYGTNIKPDIKPKKYPYKTFKNVSYICVIILNSILLQNIGGKFETSKKAKS